MTEVGIATSTTPRAGRCFDLVITVLALPLLLPVGALIAAAVYLDSPGPVLFRSWRIGCGGQPFAMWKFRKMRRDAASDTLTREGDERFTPIGRFLAITRLDELPQIYNVLSGDMALVGPRPELAEFVAEFAEEYREILAVTPGITGRAQLRFVDERRLLTGPDPEQTYRDHVLPLKVAIDLQYARQRTLAGDIAILARTALLPAALALSGLRRRYPLLRGWAPTVSAAAALVAGFVLAAGWLG